MASVLDIGDQTLIDLHHAIREIALEAYKGHGASLYTYTGTRREKGSFQEMLKVYGKQVDPVGNTVITIPETTSPDKRTTHYAPVIQVIGNSRDPSVVALWLGSAFGFGAEDIGQNQTQTHHQIEK